MAASNTTDNSRNGKPGDALGRGQQRSTQNTPKASELDRLEAPNGVGNVSDN